MIQVRAYCLWEQAGRPEGDEARKRGSSREHRRGGGNIATHNSDLFTSASPLPASALLRQAADLINAGSKVAILAGRGCLNARKEVLELAEKVGGPIIKPLLGKGVVPDDSPFTTGASACSARPPRRMRCRSATL